LDLDRRAGDVCSAFGNKESRERGELAWFTQTSHRNLLFPLLLKLVWLYAQLLRHLLGQLFNPLGPRVSGKDVVNCNAVSSNFICQCARKTCDSSSEAV